MRSRGQLRMGALGGIVQCAVNTFAAVGLLIVSMGLQVAFAAEAVPLKTDPQKPAVGNAAPAEWDRKRVETAIRNGNILLLGISGELIVPGVNVLGGLNWTPECALFFESTANGLEISSGIDVKTGRGTIIGRVSNDGIVTMDREAAQSLVQKGAYKRNPRSAQKSDMKDGEGAALTQMSPRSWPSARKGTQSFAPLRPGAVLSHRMIQASAAERMPRNASGWVLMAANNFLVTPAADAEIPDNVLWVVPGDEGGFQLVHSGPLYSGTYATIRANGDLFFGSVAETEAIPKAPDAFWPYYDEHGKVTVAPPGFVMSVPQDRSEAYHMVFKDGAPDTLYRDTPTQ